MIIAVFVLSADHADQSCVFSDTAEVNDEIQIENPLSDVLFVQYRAVFRDLLGRKCVFSPSCSQYGQESMQKHGPIVGLMMALERWTRCHPASLGYGDYPEAGMYTVADPVDYREESICWGQFLLPF
jgi:putative membrane protein insertion efficiency factor